MKRRAQFFRATKVFPRATKGAANSELFRYGLVPSPPTARLLLRAGLSSLPRTRSMFPPSECGRFCGRAMCGRSASCDDPTSRVHDSARRASSRSRTRCPRRPFPRGAMLAVSCAASRVSRTSWSLLPSPPGRHNGSPSRLGGGCRRFRAPPSAPTHSLPMRHPRNREPGGTAVAASSQTSGSRFGCIRRFFRPASSFHRPACPRRSRVRSSHSARPRPQRRTPFAVLLSISDPTSLNE
jgi:hypothetical protein